jgi:hypothetical protein
MLRTHVTGMASFQRGEWEIEPPSGSSC